jgi:uncharacterized protein (TIGR03437 family)
MTRRNKFITGMIGLVSSAALIRGFALGPDPRHTAAPGDDPLACASSSCHIGTPLNGGGGNVVVNFPDGLTYTPGVQQKLTIVITDPVAKAWGFQMSARLDSDLANGQAGDFTADPKTQLVLCENFFKTSKGCPANAQVQFIEHSSPFATNTIGVTWTPPTTDVGGVHIYVAANAANKDGSNIGDHIYTANYALTPKTTSTPKPTITAVVNGASFQPGIQSGCWSTIFGTNLSTTTRIWNTDTEIINGVLPLSLDNVKVTVNNKPAAIYFISPGQINFQAPDDTATGIVNVTVTNSSGTSTSMVAQLQRDAPGFFMFDPQGRRYVASLVANADGTATFLGPPGLFGSSGAATRPAKPGEILELYGTGFGPTNPAVKSGLVVTSAAPALDKVSVTIGGVDAEVQFAGVTGAGLYQINAVVPPTMTTGDQPIVATVNGLKTPDGAFVTITTK